MMTCKRLNQSDSDCCLKWFYDQQIVKLRVRVRVKAKVKSQT